MVKFGVVGEGPWGIKVAAAIRALGFECESCSARRPEAYEDLIVNSDIVWVAAHPEVNCKIAKLALEMLKPVIVEKPVAFVASEVKELLDLSRELRILLIVDYIHTFNEGVMNLKSDGLQRLSITLGNNGPVRDYSALWDYGSHAVAVALTFIRRPLTRIEMIEKGSCYKLHFGSVIADINVSNSLEHREATFAVSYSEEWFKFMDEHQHNPLAALISTMASLHLRGDSRTNGDLAVEVTDLLERMERCE